MFQKLITFIFSLHLQSKGLYMIVLLVLGHNSDNCVDLGVEGDYFGAEESSEFEALGKSPL